MRFTIDEEDSMRLAASPEPLDREDHFASRRPLEPEIVLAARTRWLIGIVTFVVFMLVVSASR